MKRIVSIILAAACFALACALVWTRDKSAADHLADAAPASFVPALPIADLDLLDRPVGDIRFDAVPLEDAIRTLSDRSKVKISVDWAELSRISVDQKSKVTATVSNACLADALNLIIELLPGKSADAPAYYVSDEAIFVTSAGNAAPHFVTTYINIRPLIEEMLAYADLDWDAQERNSHRSPIDNEPTRDDMIDRVTRLITDSVASDSWRDAGGTVGMIREISGVLIIEQLPGNIRGIRALLERLHESIRADDVSGLARSHSSPRPLPAGSDEPGKIPVFTVFLNIRALLFDLQSGLGAGGERSEATGIDAALISGTMDLITETVAPESWRRNGGKIADIRALGGVLAITQSADNLAAVHKLLYQLHEAATTDQRRPATQTAATEPSQVDSPSNQPGHNAMAYINIRPLVLELVAGKQPPNADARESGLPELEAVEQIKQFIRNNVAADTWQVTSETPGYLYELGGVLVVIQTPENIQAVRTALANLQAAILRNDFPPRH